MYHTSDAIVDGLAEIGITCAKPAHVKYDFPFIDEAQGALIREKGFAERLRLEQLGEKRWTVELYQALIIGRKA